MSSIQASATYDGPREGYAFKTGPEGVAYYKDSGDGGHELEAAVQMRELELEQEELDAAEGWLPYSTNTGRWHVDGDFDGDKFSLDVLSLTKPRVLKKLAQDEAMWAEARATRNRIRALSCGLLSVEEVQIVSNLCCVPSLAWVQIALIAAIYVPCLLLCGPCEIAKRVQNPPDDGFPEEHSRHGLILTDQGLVGRGPAPDYTAQAIAWENFDVDTGIEIRLYDKYNDYPCCYGPLLGEVHEPLVDPLFGNRQKEAHDPLWCIFSAGVCFPCCAYPCIKPQTAGLYHAIITAKSKFAAIDLIALAGTPEHLLASLREGSQGARALAMERRQEIQDAVLEKPELGPLVGVLYLKSDGVFVPSNFIGEGTPHVQRMFGIDEALWAETKLVFPKSRATTLPEHSSHALILTDQGLVGHGSAPDYEVQAIAWENFDVATGVEITTDVEIKAKKSKSWSWSLRRTQPQQQHEDTVTRTYRVQITCKYERSYFRTVRGPNNDTRVVEYCESGAKIDIIGLADSPEDLMAALRSGEEQARVAERENYKQRTGLGSGRENGKGLGKGKGAGRGMGGMKEVGDRRGITRGSEGGLGIGMGRDTLGLKRYPEELGSEAHVAAAKATIMLQITVPKGSPGNVITVAAPDGRQVEVQVPKGAEVGSLLNVQIPAEAE